MQPGQAEISRPDSVDCSIRVRFHLSTSGPMLFLEAGVLEPALVDTPIALARSCRGSRNARLRRQSRLHRPRGAIVTSSSCREPMIKTTTWAESFNRIKFYGKIPSDNRVIEPIKIQCRR